MTTQQATSNFHVLRLVSVLEQLPLLVPNSARLYLDIYTVKLQTSSTVTSADRQISFKVERDPYVLHIYIVYTVLPF